MIPGSDRAVYDVEDGDDKIARKNRISGYDQSRASGGGGKGMRLANSAAEI